MTTHFGSYNNSNNNTDGFVSEEGIILTTSKSLNLTCSFIHQLLHKYIIGACTYLLDGGGGTNAC